MARIIPAFTQFFDDSGDPLIDGWLHFYESGTSNTDKNTYKDINETIPNTNPLQLDGAGRCPNVFGTGAYNIISYADDGTGMAPGVQIQQFDPVGGTTDEGAFSDWDAATIYSIGEIVTASDGNYYRSLANGNQNKDPITTPTEWEKLLLVQFWNVNVTYDLDDIVIYKGVWYRSLTASNLGNDPEATIASWKNTTDELDNTILTHDMVSDADYTLSDSEDKYGSITITDTGVVLTTTRNIIISNRQRLFFVNNSTLQTLTFKTSAGTGISVLAGERTYLLCDGTNVINAAETSTIVSGTVIDTSTAATSYDYTSIPTWVKKITFMLDGVSTSGTSPVAIQLGTSGTPETTGYAGNAVYVIGAVGISPWSTAALLTTGIGATATLNGELSISLLDVSTDTWTFSGNVARTDGTATLFCMGGRKSLAGTLDTIRITTAGGTDTFDAGKVNILYE